MILLTFLAGCLTSGALEHSSIKHERNAQVLAQKGEGARAAKEAQLAASDREAARLVRESRGRYWEKEVLMR
jgi:hypothetical protein